MHDCTPCENQKVGIAASEFRVGMPSASSFSHLRGAIDTELGTNLGMHAWLRSVSLVSDK